MEASLCLREGHQMAELRPLLQRHGVEAAAMHPGVQDAALVAWFVLTAVDAAALAEAVSQLQSHPAVDAAYLKPAGELPG
jgi:hypothetical protein